MRKLPWRLAIIALAILILIAIAVYQVPSIQRRVSWRVDTAFTYMRGALSPAGTLPKSKAPDLPQPQVAVTRQPTATQPTLEATSIPTQGPTSVPTTTPTPIPKAASLAPPKWEKQDANNCGPTTLAMYLRHYGWEGDQFTISQLIKPKREDRNVNVEELAYYVRNRVGYLNFEYRVGGDLELLKAFIAAGLPIIIEEGAPLDQTYWPNDDRWAAHYLLLTGYDDASQTFIGQDSYYGPDRKIQYATLDKAWQAFNRVYVAIYPPDQEATVKSIVGADWDVDQNRRNALETAQEETEKDPNDAFAWFNVGTNLAYFDRYFDASQAYDRARELGLPQRMLRYQFGPFMAYFHGGRLDELATIIDYALKITRNSEETYLWRGWMYYRRGLRAQAIEDFRRALEENPYYQDALYALEFVGAIR
jgi:tetratricopeptide (TPR) repeat protein